VTFIDTSKLYDRFDSIDIEAMLGSETTQVLQKREGVFGQIGGQPGDASESTCLVVSDTARDTVRSPTYFGSDMMGTDSLGSLEILHG
tara:strand:- start:117 stop:380 length:264 start_codon:yes stop_codon:yes gene_type:complete